ncbi:PFGI-1 class ICE element type IV pilus protein PilL2 [Pseudomonas chlororaphis]|uniref:PFGI-1 class ICE element type IV pilus protein PilL2 n=1 Tax=Pseudomonas chlororaphis TaxID=587753 RepID=UPI00131F8A8F|nr:TcpQ domain-containing protein [Pseudomonas chlororaphis]QHC91335.1 pilus assembly protein PilL [Pseudomonas chlororaphis]
MIRHFTTFSLLAFLASCTTQTTSAPKPAFDSSRNPDMLSPDLYPGGAVPEKEPVVRYGRYTLVSTLPDSGQRDLMAQIIDVNIPANMKPNVRDAMQYVMDRSGYSLCSADTGHVNILYTRPLPAAQYKLGPMTLRNTLQVLAGPAWQVKVDEVNRQVCYVLRPGYQLPDLPRPASTLIAKQGVVTPSNTKPVDGPSTLAGSAVTVAAVPTPPAITTSGSVPPSPVLTASTTTPDHSPVKPAKDGTIEKPLPAPVPSPAKVAAGPVASKPATTIAISNVPATTVAPPPKPAPVAQVPLPQIWTAAPGTTLRDSVEDWAKRANWAVIWRAEGLDYPIEAPLRFEGSFQDAVSQIFPLYDGAARPFKVDGNPVQRLIVVVEKK